LEIFCSKKIKYTMENSPKRNIYYTFCHIIFFLSSESIVIAFRFVFHSVVQILPFCDDVII
jgi:hypothetical protein